MRLAPVVYPGKMFWDTAVIKPVWGHPLPDESLHRFPHVIRICSEQAEGSPMGVKRNQDSERNRRWYSLSKLGVKTSLPSA